MGLYDSAVDIVDAAKMIAETGIEIMADIDEIKLKTFNIVISGDIEAAKQELEELITYGEDTLDNMQETYDTLQLLYTDNEIKTMLTDFPEQYFKAMPTVEQAGAASGLALSLLFALVTGGAGAAASAASKAPMFIKAAKKIQEITVLLKKVKLHKKQSKPHNNKIAESTDKPKEDKLKEKEKKKFKCDWKNCKGEHTSNINKKYPRNGSVSKGKATSGNDYESEWISAGLEPWIMYSNQGKSPFITREKLIADFPQGVKPKTEIIIKKALTLSNTYITQKHHILSIHIFSQFNALSHNIKLTDWNINNKVNGLCLPYFRIDIVRHNLQCHRGPHPPAYNENLYALLRKLDKKCIKYCDDEDYKKLARKLDSLANRAEKHITEWRDGWYLRSTAEQDKKWAYSQLNNTGKKK